MLNEKVFVSIFKALKSSEDIPDMVMKYNNVSYEGLYSILSQKYLAHIKKTNHIHREPKVIDSYMAAYNNGEDILSMAERINFAPCLLARIIISNVLGMKKHDVYSCIKNPLLIPDERLRREVQQCVEEDNHYSPFLDKIKHSIGLEYEFILQEKLYHRQIPFESEAVLREKGAIRTPDIKLPMPIAVNGRIVNWIDSKAMFGMPETHENQLRSYVNHYGPGLVIYWFGCVDTLCKQDPDVQVLTTFPENIVSLGN